MLTKHEVHVEMTRRHYVGLFHRVLG
uniref:Uncharacterized protein n=1 Tax=Arundo donax TaxID=35708 RepID=A0A0A9BC91_ARUDO